MRIVYDHGTEFQPVTVDQGDLAQVLQSAEAWAGYLRQRAAQIRQGALRMRVTDAGVHRYIDAAERIEHAVHNLRMQVYESGGK